MANAMSEMMERIKSGNIQLKSVRTVSLIVSRPVSRSRLHAVKPVLSEIIYNCFLVVCRSSIEIFKRCNNRLLKTSIDYGGEKNKISWCLFNVVLTKERKFNLPKAEKKFRAYILVVYSQNSKRLYCLWVFWKSYKDNFPIVIDGLLSGSTWIFLMVD